MSNHSEQYITTFANLNKSEGRTHNVVKRLQKKRFSVSCLCEEKEELCSRRN